MQLCSHKTLLIKKKNWPSECSLQTSALNCMAADKGWGCLYTEPGVAGNECVNEKTINRAVKLSWESIRQGYLLGSLDLLFKWMGQPSRWSGFIYLAAPGLSCSMWDLVPQTGIEPRPPTLRAWGLSHWITREVLGVSFISMLIPFMTQIYPHDLITSQKPHF